MTNSPHPTNRQTEAGTGISPLRIAGSIELWNSGKGSSNLKTAISLQKVKLIYK